MHTPLHVSLLGLGLTTLASAQFGAGSTYFPGAEPEGVVLADFDGDGDLDLAATTDAPDKISILTNTGGGTFTGPIQVFLGNGTSPQDLVAGDVDGDGDMDLIVALKNVNAIQVITNVGGAFVPGATTSVAGDEPRHLAIGDIDGDGDLDVVTSNRKTDNLSILRNTGGAFALSATVPGGAEPRKVVLADFDGDGDRDLAVSAHDERTIRILSNNGGGTFTSQASLFVGAQLRPDGLAAGDMDGDGDQDLIAAVSGNTAAQMFVSVFVNQGGGSWGVPLHFPSGGMNPDDVEVADLNGDGLLDAAVSNQDSNTVASLAGLGGGVLGAPSLVGTGTRPGDVELGDLDGNGSPDLAVADRDSNDVMVFLNQNAGGGIGTSYCGPANLNSSGLSAVISAVGSTSVAANNVRLDAAQMPSGEFGYFVNSMTQGFVMPPGSQGNLCLGGSIGRHTANVMNTGAAGEFSLQLNLTMVPTPGGMVAVGAGETWNWQAWFRDGASSNFTDGISILFQ